MRIRLSLALLLFPIIVLSRERVIVKGRIVNSRGEAVEYVQVGVPKLQIGAISSVDGRFEIEVPRDTLEFFHVSYLPASYPVTGPAEDVVITLQEQELSPAVFIAGKTREKYLLRPGLKMNENLGGAGFCLPEGADSGLELGSVARTRKPFLIRDIQFTILENHIPGCVVSINIYRVEGDPEIFTNILCKPIYFSIAESDARRDYDIQPEESILLDPGEYFIAFQIVATDNEAVRTIREKPESERDPKDLHLYTPLYFKSSYERSVAMGKMTRIPVNIGVSVKGLEYQ